MAKKKKKIHDFGQKINGAWKFYFIKDIDEFIDALDEMSEAEKRNYVVKGALWPNPNAYKLCTEEGVEPVIAYWRRRVRRYAFENPVVKAGMTYENALKEYAKALLSLRADLEIVKSVKDFQEFYNAMADKKTDYSGAISIYKLRSLRWQLSNFQKYVDMKNFPYNRKTVTRKRTTFQYPPLSNIEREGVDYRKDKSVKERDWEKVFGFRGVQFGNYTTQRDRQRFLNCGYDAIHDLAAALEIDEKDITFSGDLALAYGARGHGSAGAHYEPVERVINLTRKNGAGCLAHEWAHALDHRIALWCGTDTGELATEAKSGATPEIFRRLVQALKYDDGGDETEFYRGSKEFDGKFVAAGNGVWSSDAEMFARAMACYIKDCYGKKSDFLFGYADVFEFEFDNQFVCAIPQGEEREYFDELFDALFRHLKKEGFLHAKEHCFEVKKKTVQEVVAAASSVFTVQGSEGQMQFVFN